MASAENRPEKGSVLLLFPAATLVVFVLAAMAVDLSAGFLAQRELRDVTAAAADAAAAVLAPEEFYEAGRVALESGTASRLARQRVVAGIDGGRHRDLQVAVTVTDAHARRDSAAPGGAAGGICGPTVTVTASTRVDHIFGRALPGGEEGISVRAVSAARAQGATACL